MPSRSGRFDRLWEQPAAGPCASLAFPTRMPGPLRRPIPAGRVRGWYECGRPRPRSASPPRFRSCPVKNNLSQSRQDRKENSRGCQTMPAGPLGRSALRESLGVVPFAVSCSLRAETRSAKGERHATFYEQISGPDSWNTEWLRPLGVSGFAAAVELRLPGPGFAVPGGAGDGTIPLAEPYPVQGLLGPREARQPEGEAGQRPTV